MLMLLGELVAGNELGHDDNELNSGDALDITTIGADDDSTDSLDNVDAAELFSDTTGISAATSTDSFSSDSLFFSGILRNFLSLNELSGVAGDEVDDVDSIGLDRCFSFSNFEVSFNFPHLIILFFLEELAEGDEEDDLFC